MTRTELRQLLLRYINGDATAEEMRFLESYYAHFDQRPETLSRLVAADLQQDKENVLEHLHSRLEHISSESVSVTPLRPTRWRGWMAAASLSILLAGGGAYFISTRNKEKPGITVHYKGDVAPGGNRATLTLADGRKITLEDAHNGTLAEQGATTVQKAANGQLVYRPTGKEVASIGSNILSTPLGGQYRLLLPDGSKVWLNAASSLHFPTQFTGITREVTLTGEGYFEIARDSAKPFIVNINEMKVQVLGTKFNIMAYGDEDQIKSTLLEGAVNILRGNSTTLLRPGEQAVLSRSGNFKVMDHIDLEDELAWKYGDFRFKNSGIAVIMRSLARWYNMEVEYTRKPTDLFNVDIPRNVPLSEILKLLEMTNSIHFQIEGKKILVRP